MSKHEIKQCPRCGTSFECKIGSIFLCQCWPVALDEEERQFLKEKYTDCLCASCMEDEKHVYHQKKFEEKIKQYGH